MKGVIRTKIKQRMSAVIRNLETLRFVGGVSPKRNKKERGYLFSPRGMYVSAGQVIFELLDNGTWQSSPVSIHYWRKTGVFDLYHNQVYIRNDMDKSLLRVFNHIP